jgi:hypothetical protein
MADITYIVNEDAPENITGFEQYSQNDKELLNSFEVNSTFNPSKNYMELHIFSLSDELLESDAEYTNFTQLGNAQSVRTSGASILTVDPVYDSRIYGYDLGGVKLLYHFLNDLYTVNNTTTEFFIESISADRTEVRLLPVTLKDSDVVTFTEAVKNKLQAQSYFDGFRLNFKNNDLFIAVNIDTVDLNQGKAVVVKLYEPLLDIYSEKSRLNIVEIVSDSAAYEVDSDITMDEIIQPTLRPANFNLEISDESVVPTGYLNYNELFSYPVNNANSEIYSLFNEKGIDVSVDFTNYSDFVHFSSAEERLNNFKYKLDLITDYSASLSAISTGAAGSRTYFENLISGIVSNFDHYERFLYYESGSSSWPKSNTTRPYENIPSVDPITFVPNPIVSAWYSTQLSQAIAFDRTNGNSLVNAIPSYLKDDDSNVNYLTFVYMVGQHFDNLWTYARAVTDKYDADNRMNHGISKDLVGEALKNFGVKLYTSNKSIEDLFGSLIGQVYQSGSEYITDYIVAIPTGSNTPVEPVGFDNYQKEIQKRIYHNLPLLLKSKGTERGLRALINCFGIPSDILQIKYFGGRNTNERPFFGDYSYYTSSLDKVRLDNTGSIIPKNTLSGNTSNIKRDSKYTDDLHNIEVGFAPSDNVDRYIISHSAATFNIDDYIGDPRSLTSPSYTGLYQIAEGILGNLERYDLQDYVRLIKFFDNVIFKMVKDFIPARVVADTGIIIKPNLLNRSKAKSVTLGVTRPEQSGSVDTAFIESTDGGVYYSGSTEIITAYNRQVKTPEGLKPKYDHNHEEARYNGELYNSEVVITNGELGKKNPYLNPTYPPTYYDINIYNTPPAGVCLIQSKPPGFATPNVPVMLDSYFINTDSSTIFKIGPSPSPAVVVNNPNSYTFNGTAGQVFYISATDPTSIDPCIKENTVELQICDLQLVNPSPELVSPGEVLNLPSYITNPTGQITYRVNGNVISNGIYTVPVDAITQGLSVITLKVESNQGTCIRTKTFNINPVTTTVVVQSIYVNVAELQVVVINNGNNTVTDKGIIYSVTPNPTIGAPGVIKLSSNAPINAPFISQPYPLNPNTQYYVRSYATTSQGTTYSSVETLITQQSGVVTLTSTATPSDINFTINATNPASLPILRNDDYPVTLRITNDYNNYLFNFPVNNVYAGEATLPSYTFNNVFSKSSTLLQPNTPYTFRATVGFRQGWTGDELRIVSPQATATTYTRPPITIGTFLGGGVVYKVIQRGDTGYNGVTQVFVLASANHGATNAADDGTTVASTNRVTAGTNPPAFARGGQFDWKLPSISDFTAIWLNRSLLPSSYTAQLNNRNFWVTDPGKYYDFDITNATATGNIKTGGSGSSLYVRSVRTYSF